LPPSRKSWRGGAKKSITSVSSGNHPSCSVPPGMTTTRSAFADGPRTSHAQAQMDERGENDRDFSIDAKMQDVRAFLQCRLRPLARRKHPAASTAQRAANEDDPGFYPLRVIYGGHCPRGCVVGQSFSRDRYTYDGGWDIYAAGSPRRLMLGRFSPRNRPSLVPLAPRQGADRGERGDGDRGMRPPAAQLLLAKADVGAVSRETRTRVSL
jgi:hypothetical protein